MHGSLWLTMVKAGMVKKAHIWGIDHWEMMVFGTYYIIFNYYFNGMEWTKRLSVSIEFGFMGVCPTCFQKSISTSFSFSLFWFFLFFKFGWFILQSKKLFIRLQKQKQKQRCSRSNREKEKKKKRKGFEKRNHWNLK